jgi:hypothetical protein
MSSAQPPKRRPGRPPGSGYPTDAPVLERIADLLVCGECKSVREAALKTGNEDDAAIRRFQRHFAKNGPQLKRAARIRANPPSENAVARSAPVGWAWNPHPLQSAWGEVMRRQQEADTLRRQIKEMFDRINYPVIVRNKLFDDIDRINRLTSSLTFLKR